MILRVLHRREQIKRFLRREICVHLYDLGDLDDFFFPHTSWYGWFEGQHLCEIALLYHAPGQTVLLAFAAEPARMQDMLAVLSPRLPGSFYAHLSPDLESVFSNTHHIQPYGAHAKMILTQPEIPAGLDARQVAALSPADLPEILDFYQASYPDNCFDPRMLTLGCYYGLRQDGRLVSVAGVHVFSPRYRVAALGNIATHPLYRGRGYGRMVTAHLCQQLAGQVDHIGLNVRADNQPALRCYQGLGFQVCASYGEFSISLNKENDL